VLKMARKKQTSEFGKGFVYNLILFSKHFERVVREKEMLEKMDKEMKEHFNPYSNFFYTATDHLYDLQIPKKWQRKNCKIGILIRELHDLCFTYRLPMDKKKEATEKDFLKAFELLHQLSMEIDKKLGVKVIKGDWE